MVRLVIIFTTVWLLALTTGCTQLKTAIKSKAKSGTIGITSSSNLLTITSVNTIVSNNVDMLEVLGSQFDSWCVASANGTSSQPSTCTLEVREGSASGTTTQNLGTEMIEPNILRFVAPSSLSPTATVRVYVQQVDGYSNELPIGGATLSGATDDIRNYVRARRYQAAFVHHPINPLSGLVDPLERDSHGTIYNLYSTNLGRTMLLIGALSNSQQSAMQRFRFSFEPATLDAFVPTDYNQRVSFAKWKNLIVGSRVAAFGCETSSQRCYGDQNYSATLAAFQNSLGSFEWEPWAVSAYGYPGSGAYAPASLPTPAPNEAKKPLDFYVAESRFGVFDTPVHAMTAPDVQSFAPPPQVAGLVDPLGYAARPVGPANATSCPSLPLPEGMIWQKIVPFCMDRPPQRGIRSDADVIGDSTRNKGDIVCNPGPWDRTSFASQTDNFVPDCADTNARHGCPLSSTVPGSGVASRAGAFAECGGYAARIFGDRNSPLNSACFRYGTNAGQPANLVRTGAYPAYDNLTRMYGHPLNTANPNVTVNTSAWNMTWPAPAALPAPVVGSLPAGVTPIQTAQENTPPQDGPLDGRTPHRDCIFVVLPESYQSSDIFSATGTSGSANCTVGPGGNGKYCPVTHNFINQAGVPTGNRYSSSYIPSRTQPGDVSTGTGVYPLCVLTRKVD